MTEHWTNELRKAYQDEQARYSQQMKKPRILYSTLLGAIITTINLISPQQIPPTQAETDALKNFQNKQNIATFLREEKKKALSLDEKTDSKHPSNDSRKMNYASLSTNIPDDVANRVSQFYVVDRSKVDSLDAALSDWLKDSTTFTTSKIYKTMTLKEETNNSFMFVEIMADLSMTLMCIAAYMGLRGFRVQEHKKKLNQIMAEVNESRPYLTYAHFQGINSINMSEDAINKLRQTPFLERLDVDTVHGEAYGILSSRSEGGYVPIAEKYLTPHNIRLSAIGTIRTE
jgi:hypothetical protein